MKPSQSSTLRRKLVVVTHSKSEIAFVRWWKRSGMASICPSYGADNEAYLAARGAWAAGAAWQRRNK